MCDNPVDFIAGQPIGKQVLVELGTHLMSQPVLFLLVGQNYESPGLAIMRRRRPSGCFQDRLQRFLWNKLGQKCTHRTA